MPDFNLDAVKARQAAARAEAIVELDVPDTGHMTAQAIAACGLCDADGYHGSSVCDHTDHRAAAARGMALVREALTKPTGGPVGRCDTGQALKNGPEDAQRQETTQEVER